MTQNHQPLEPTDSLLRELDPMDAHFRDRDALVLARCSRPHCLLKAALYVVMPAEHADCETCRANGEKQVSPDNWERIPIEGDGCACDPPPRLPDGDELLKLITRARKAQTSRPPRPRVLRGRDGRVRYRGPLLLRRLLVEGGDPGEWVWQLVMPSRAAIEIRV